MNPRLSVLLLASLAVVSCRHVAPSVSPDGGAVGRARLQRSALAVPVRFFMESFENGTSVLSLPQSGVKIAVRDEPVLTEADIVDVDISEVELGKCLVFHLSAAAARRIDELMAQGRGRRLVLTVNDVTLGARRLDQSIGNGALAMFVEVPDVYLPRLLATMKPNGSHVGSSPAFIERN